MDKDALLQKTFIYCISLSKAMDRGKRSEPAELLAIVLFGFLLRLFAGRSSLTENGILLPGYDEFYHMRRILYTVNHFPDTLWFDSYLNYPHGLNITWPPLFDQISATLCVILGQHTKAGVEMVSSFVPVLIGILAIVVIYYMVRELFNHRVALMASFLTALAPNYILNTMFAATDHHSLEVLLQLTMLLFVIMAISRSEKRYLYSCAAGVAMAALAYTWQGADIYLGIFLVYAFIRMTLDLKRWETIYRYSNNTLDRPRSGSGACSAILEYSLAHAILHGNSGHDSRPIHHVCSRSLHAGEEDILDNVSAQHPGPGQSSSFYPSGFWRIVWTWCP